jgi:pimeloyl-ACP methyl ester carboxylesterase
MGIPRFDLEFTRLGDAFDSVQVESLLKGTDRVSDLLVLSHGWNNDMAEAKALYSELLSNVEGLLREAQTTTAETPLEALRSRRFAACQVFWPSKRFADEDLIPGGGSASAGLDGDGALVRVLRQLAMDEDRLGHRELDPARLAEVERALALVGRLEFDAAARREFVETLRGLLDRTDLSEDDGSLAFFEADAEDLLTSLSPEVLEVPTSSEGGAAGVGQAAGILGDFMSGMKASARRLANYATYYRMKSRAGLVGREGLAPVLARLRNQRHEIRLHLVGHSFGGRLVIAAANALPDKTSAVTISLLQAAFSHYGLSQDFGNGKAGSFRDVIAASRASGPIIVTHTKNDRAVGIAYPIASRVAQQNASSIIGDESDPYGGMGRNGAQRTAEATGNQLALGRPWTKYVLAQGGVFNFLADEFIRDHGDVRGREVAYAVLSAAAAL